MDLAEESGRYGPSDRRSAALRAEPATQSQAEPAAANALTALAERCEAATGPDRELDALIWCALNGKRYRGHNPAYASYGADNSETQVEYSEPPKRTRMVTTGRGVPHAQPWTASLDAAMTLVPSDEWSVSIYYGPWVSGNVRLLHAIDHPEEIIGDAHELALAMCAAALRARAAQGIVTRQGGDSTKIEAPASEAR